MGPFTADVANNEFEKYATDVIADSLCILEYFEPASSYGGRLNISKVIHGYKVLIPPPNEGGRSADCHIDINCPPGDDWCVEKRSVARILCNNNTSVCSGVLLNNTKENLQPYLLTAFHCGDFNRNGVIDQSERMDMHTWIFRFHYWKEICDENEGGYNYTTLTGAFHNVDYAETDVLLVRLLQKPFPGSGIVYSGWDRSVNFPSNGTCIHHPMGDVMKISKDYHTLIPAPYCNGPNNYWRAAFDVGLLQHGSSGSPIFNNNKKVVGQLAGNCQINCLPIPVFNRCWCDTFPDPFSNNIILYNNFGEFGRFDLSWFGGGTSVSGLKDRLDPDVTTLTSVNSTSPTSYLINKTILNVFNKTYLSDVHIEGMVTSSGINGLPSFICPPNLLPFVTESNSNFKITAVKKILIKSNTYFRQGSKVSISTINEVDCNDNLDFGDYINTFCNVQLNSINNPTHPNISTKMYGKNNLNFYQNLNSKSKDNLVKVYPNPNTGSFKIVFHSNETNKVDIRIIDVLGRNILTTVVSSGQTIEIPNAKNGIFILKVFIFGKEETIKVYIR